MIKCIVFDLDGTLVKSHETIYKTTIKTLENLKCFALCRAGDGETGIEKRLLNSIFSLLLVLKSVH